MATYIHNAAAENLGRLGVLVALKSAGKADVLTDLGRKIAMHVAAVNPLSLNVDELPAEAIERERAVYADQARASGKPEDIIAKMVEGRIRKYYEEVVLLEQVWVHDGESRVKAVAKKAGADLVAFEGFALGEGIERQSGDFAAEVAAAAGVAPENAPLL